MNWIFQNELVIIAFTAIIYFGAQKLQKKTGIVVLNPILITIAIIIPFLIVFHIDYEVYNKGGKYIEFFLKPAVVALGVPLYQQLEKIKKQALHIIISQLIGCLVGIVSVVLIAKMMGASKEIIFSLAPKSVTTPIAIEVSKTIGGIAPLTASVVIVVGIFGAIFGYGIMKLTKVKNPIAQSLSMGNAAHAVGTSKSMEISPNFGAMSSIGLIINGIFTAILSPYILKLMGHWITF
ncbi:TIGR00659 family protein [Mariniphaga anaerophila]|uniref:TIGR00659 family protein n=1 Tax=Mariniphaga anaerophila TaxID=1484053 RepID=A0A1M4YB46_9BACT|nr:LrgB family protein [Mariniphaga anaerophila]SHF02955.1 TIGR00659 family protein [Mariniphaga anaerophila]